jgi:cytochrome c553
MKRLWVPAAAIAGAMFGGSSLAAGSVEAGATKSVVCQSCHGANGVSVSPEWPNLAGLGYDYMNQQLQNFKEGKRANEVMAPMAMTLSSEDMADLAAYFSSLSSRTLIADPTYAKAGEKLYRGGDAARAIPACVACHNPTGRGIDSAKFPSLRGQQSVYVTKQLHDYAAGTRTTGPNNIMQTIAKRLSENDTRAVAAYVQGLQ